MKLSLRLSLLTIVSLVALFGLAILFFFMLPGDVDEFARRNSERALEKSADGFLAYFDNDLKAHIETLEKLAEDPALLNLLTDDQKKAVSVKLAEELANKYKLGNLSLVYNDGMLASLYPDAAKVGLKDVNRLELARASAKKHVFMPIKRSKQKDDKASNISRLYVAVPVSGGLLWALSSRNITQNDIDLFCLKYNVKLVRVITDDKESTKKVLDTERVIVIKGLTGEHVFSVVLSPIDTGGRIMRQMLVRRILMIAVPWGFFFAFVIIWLGWPAKKRE